LVYQHQPLLPLNTLLWQVVVEVEVMSMLAAEAQVAITLHLVL
jgi:hypothetical protein